MFLSFSPRRVDIGAFWQHQYRVVGEQQTEALAHLFISFSGTIERDRVLAEGPENRCCRCDLTLIILQPLRRPDNPVAKHPLAEPR
jgi:hypothetical protein